MFNAKTARLSQPGSGLVGRWLLASALVVAAAGAAFPVHAEGRHGHGMGGSGMMMFGGSPERIGRAVDHMLDGLNATETQRSQIKQIATAAAADLKAQRETGLSLRERSLQVFTTPNVDANAAEALRQQMVAQHDQASKRVLQAMLEVSRVLTPEQRAKVGERVKQRQTARQERMERLQRERPQK